MHPTICDHVLDVVQNAFEAGASEVRLAASRVGARLEVAVVDDGKGMDAATAAPFWALRVTSPMVAFRKRLVREQAGLQGTLD